MRSISALILLALSSQVATDERLFGFDSPDAAQQWQAVNDGVMGGISDGRFRITADQTMEFSGTLSLENNGGFASVRSRPAEGPLVSGPFANDERRVDRSPSAFGRLRPDILWPPGSRDGAS